MKSCLLASALLFLCLGAVQAQDCTPKLIWNNHMGRYSNITIPSSCSKPTITFNWAEGHNLLVLPRYDCGTIPSATTLAATAPSGSFTTPPLGKDTTAYACGVSGHCAGDGQIVAVTF